MKNSKTAERKFSMTVSAPHTFAQEERDFLSQVVTEEIKKGADIIVDEVFEERNADEYILSGDSVSAERLAEAMADYVECKVVLKEVQ
ncbi:MAG: hypothetical protein OXB96_00370 [Candidatus Kaiserbacteria bacterium]|nr:hypothetical protein [Candidatus Kaiserbacteria bacterium]